MTIKNTVDIIGVARSVLRNAQGWSLEYLTPWREYDVVLAYNPQKQQGNSGLPIYILVEGREGRFATSDETLEIMNLSLPDLDEAPENPDEIVEILE